MFRQPHFDDHMSDKDPNVAAAIAEEGLRYVTDTSRGYHRKRAGKSFSYYDKDGKRIANLDILRRIKSIGIPLLPTSPYGYVHHRAGISRQLVSIRAAANSIDITRSGESFGIKTNTSTLWSLRQRYRPCAGVLRQI